LGEHNVGGSMGKKYLFFGILCVFVLGCSPQHHHTSNVQPPKGWVKTGRCKKLGVVKGKNVTVVITQNCRKPGATTVTTAITDLTKKGIRAAAKETISIITKVLKYKPKHMTIISKGRLGKVYIIIMEIGEANFKPNNYY